MRRSRELRADKRRLMRRASRLSSCGLVQYLHRNVPDHVPAQAGWLVVHGRGANERHGPVHCRLLWMGLQQRVPQLQQHMRAVLLVQCAPVDEHLRKDETS